MQVRPASWAVVLALAALWLPAARGADPVTVVDLAVDPGTGGGDSPLRGAAAAVASSAQAESFEVVEAAIDPDTGGLAVVLPTRGQVLLYPKFAAGAGKKLEPIAAKVAGFPAGIAYKKFKGRAYFAVVCHLGKEMVLLDAATLKAEKRIALEPGLPLSVASSAVPDDPLVYYTARVGEPPRTGVVFGWVNLTTGVEEGPKGGVRGADEFAAAPGGTRVFTRIARSMHTFDVHEAPKPDGSVKLPAGKRTRGTAEGPGLVADPRGEFVAAGTRVWSLREGKEVARLPLFVAFASPTRPVLLGFDSDYKQLHAVSTNSLRVVGSVGLALAPAERRLHKEVEVREGDGVTIAVPRVQVLEDPTTRTVLVATGRTIRLIPYSAFKLPDEPALAVDVGGALEFTAGRRHAVKVTPTAPGVAVELTAGPDGMTLEGGALTWTPGDAAVGLHPTTLRLSARGTTRTVALTVRARRPSLTLPFVPGHVSADGAVAVFLRQDVDEQGKPSRSSQVVVVNLDKHAVEVERKMLVGLTTAAIDGRHVYVGLAESDAVKVLDRKDLSDRGLIYTAGRPADIALTGGDLVLVTSWKRDRSGRERPEAFDAIGLKPKPFVGDPVKDARGAVRRGQTVAPVRVAGGWWHDGAVYDAKFEKVRAILSPRDFWVWHPKAKVVLTNPPLDPPLDTPAHGPGRWYTPWGVSLRNSQLLASGERIGYVPASATPPTQWPPSHRTVVLPDRPAVACLTISQKPGRDKQPVVRAEVTFYNLTAAEAGATIVLSEQPADPDPHAAPLNRTPLSLASYPGGRLVAVVGREVFALKVPDLDHDKFPRPLHVPPDFPVTVVSGEEVSVRLPADGGKPPVTFTLADEVTGVRIDERTGRLAIAPRELVAEVTDRLRKTKGDTTLKDYLAEVGPRFERLTGKKPAGIPVWVPVSLIARDKLLGKAVAEFGFFVDVPAEGVRAKPGEKP